MSGFIRVIICEYGAISRFMFSLYLNFFKYQVISIEVLKVKGGEQILHGYYKI